MKLNAPTKLAWIVAVALGVIGLIGMLIELPVITVYAFWIVFAGLVLLVLSNCLKGL